MTRAAEAELLGDLFDGERRFPDEQVARSREAHSQHVGVDRHTSALPEGALQVARAYAHQRSEVAQGDSPGEVRLDIVDDEVQAVSQTARAPRG